MFEPKEPGNLKLRLHRWAVMDLNPAEMQSWCAQGGDGEQSGVCPAAAVRNSVPSELRRTTGLRQLVPRTHQGGRVHWVSNWVLVTL